MKRDEPVELEIEVVGPELGMAFWTDRVDGVDVVQTMTRSMPTAQELQQFFLLVRDGAEAAAAVIGVVEVIKRMLGKRPNLKQTMRIRVRAGRRVSESDVARISELGCDVEFVWESEERFDGGPPMPPRYQEQQQAEENDRG